MIGPLIKALDRMIHGGASNWIHWFLPATRIDYARDVGDALGSNVVISPIMWIARAFPEARLAIRVGEETMREHEALGLLATPNPFYSGEALWMATLLSFLLDGNSYWAKIRNGMGKPVQLWWLPHASVWPRWSRDGSDFISHYEYKPDGTIAPVRLEVADVVHFRHGIDPRNPRKGLSPLHAILREVFTDDEAANYTASILRNRGVIGTIISPEKDVVVSPEDLKATKDYVAQEFGGDKRGLPLVIGGATDVKSFGTPPSDMALGDIRDISEERVCAALGIPSAIVGFGSGLQQTKVGATMEELRQLAWTAGILPLQRILSGELNRSLLPELEANAQVQLFFDTSEVKALQESQDKRAIRLNTMVAGGWMTVAEARMGMGLPVDESHQLYLRPFSAIEVPVNGAEAPKGLKQDAAVVQTVICSKERFQTEAEARRWVLDHDFRADKVDETETSFRFRQRDPGDFIDGSFRTIRLDDGVQAVVGRLKKGAKARLNRQQSRIYRSILEDRRRLEPKFEKDVLAFLGALGAAAERETAAVLRSKQFENDVESIMQQLGMAERESDLRAIFGRNYILAATNLAQSVSSVLGAAVGLPDPVQLEILALGGRRAGLVDLTTNARRILFEALERGRDQGLGPLEIARQIRDALPAGPWTSSAVRAKVIARTETRFAQTESALRLYSRMEGVGQVQVIDARLGPTDDFCESVDGNVVSFDEARFLQQEEHPNGTRDFVPVFERQLEA